MVTKEITSVLERLLERTSKGLANAISVAIGDGSIPEGTLLPSIRAFADELELSPSTVSAAWRILAHAGTIRTDGRHGTVVLTRRGPGPTRYRRALERSNSFGLDLSTGLPDVALLPSLAPALNKLHRARTLGSYLDDPIIPRLAEALQDDWPYETSLFTVVDGAMDALDLVATRLLRFGDSVIVENPSFPPLLDLLDAIGVRIIGVDVDADGVIPNQLRVSLAHRPTAVFLQPRAQNPSGTSMTARRAAQLVALLKGTTTFVIEDDSAGSIASTNSISLGKWLPEQTLHIRSFSKSHGPDLRIAAVSGPSSVMDGVRERRLLGQGWTSRLLQSVLLDLLTRKESRQQVSRARDAYAYRRSMITSELRRLGVPIESGDGLNLWLPVLDETAALVFLASRGIGTAAGSPFMTKSETTPHLRVTVGLIKDDFARLAAEFAGASNVSSYAGPR